MFFDFDTDYINSKRHDKILPLITFILAARFPLMLYERGAKLKYEMVKNQDTSSSMQDCKLQWLFPIEL